MELVIILTGMGVMIPITAIVSNAWLKGRQLSAKAGLSKEDKDAMRQLIAENKALKNRVENLELMIADIDLDALKSGEEQELLK